MNDLHSQPATDARRKTLRKHSNLEVYQLAFAASMTIFQLSRQFPREERYSLTDQIRRSSRSICANLAEAWRKRRYPAAFVSKLSDCEGEAAETQVWIQFAAECAYLDKAAARAIYRQYDSIIAKLVTMLRKPQAWTLS